MDKEQARFVLRSFRPDGSDVNDKDFSEALAIAMEDRELGEWLAGERAFDAAFADALNTVTLPDSLKNDIFQCLASNRGDFPEAADDYDSAMIGAMAGIRTPAGLREEILTSMARTAVVVKPRVSRWRKLSIPIAAAAGVAFAVHFTSQPPLTGGSSIAVQPVARTLTVDSLQQGFINTYESPIFNLDDQKGDVEKVITHLKSRKLPCPSRLPRGLQKLESIGCRPLVIDGKEGSLICYDIAENGVVHLVVFKRDDVKCKLPCRDHPDFEENDGWAAARWEDDRNVFILISHTDVKKLAALF